MEGNKRTLSLVAIAVAIGVIYYAVTELMAADPAEPTSEQPAPAVVADDADDTGDAEDADDTEAHEPSLSPAQRLERGAILRTDRYEARIDPVGGGISRFLITGDPRFTRDEGEPHDVITANTELFPAHASLRVDLARIGIPDDAVWEVTQVSDTEVRLSWEGEGVRVTRSLTAGEGPYQIWSTTRIQNLRDEPVETRLELNAYHYVEREDESGGFLSIGSRSPQISHGLCVYGDETVRKERANLVLEPGDDDTGPHGYGANDVHVASVENVYFAQAMAPHGDPAGRCGLYAQNFFEAGEADGSLFRAMLAYPFVTLPPGGDVSYQTLAFFGPKDPSALNLAGHHLPEVVDLGFFSLIARQLARLLSFLHQYVPNWGLAIILLTLMIRLTLFPLTNLSFKSMARMRQLKPEIDRVNELYKDDAEKKGAAIMELYRKNKINPLSGCLPSVVQLPVWWALYTSLSTNIELYHMPFALWWTDLSSPDPYYVLPLMLGALMHLQQRLSPTTMDPAQAKMMMWMMPIMITVFMLFLPSGLCLYMLTNSALGIAQQKLNEVRLAREAPATAAARRDDASDDEPDGDFDDQDDDAASEKPHKRRPKRKRRVRRGRI